METLRVLWEHARILTALRVIRIHMWWARHKTRKPGHTTRKQTHK